MKTKKQTVIQLSIARTDQGVRVRADQWLVEAGKEEIVKQVVADVLDARPLIQQADLLFFAVRPFESKNVGRQYEENHTSYARLLEHFPAARPGLAVDFKSM